MTQEIPSDVFDFLSGSFDKDEIVYEVENYTQLASR